MTRRLDRILAVLVLAAVIASGIVAVNRINAGRRHDRVVAYRQDVRSWQEKMGGCVRSKLDRRLERQGWSTARTARLKAAAAAPTADVRTFNERAAAAYRLIVTSYRARIEGLVCLKVYPEPPAPAGVHRSRDAAPAIHAARAADQAGAEVEQRIRAASLGRPTP
jgi:hypothetical protein